MVNSMMDVRFWVRVCQNRVHHHATWVQLWSSHAQVERESSGDGKGEERPTVVQHQGQKPGWWFRDLWIGVGGWGGDGRVAHIIRDIHNKYMHLRRPQYTREYAVVSLELWNESQSVNSDSFTNTMLGQSPNFSDPTFPRVTRMRWALLPLCCVLRIM